MDPVHPVFVGGAVFLVRVARAPKVSGSPPISAGESRRSRAEHEAGLQEVATLELVDSDFLGHLSCTYLSWNSGEARVTNHRVLSSGAWFRSFAVCGLSTPSR